MFESSVARDLATWRVDIETMCRIPTATHFMRFTTFRVKTRCSIHVEIAVRPPLVRERDRYQQQLTRIVTVHVVFRVQRTCVGEKLCFTKTIGKRNDPLWSYGPRDDQLGAIDHAAVGGGVA